MLRRSDSQTTSEALSFILKPFLWHIEDYVTFQYSEGLSNSQTAFKDVRLYILTRSFLIRKHKVYDLLMTECTLYYFLIEL